MKNDLNNKIVASALTKPFSTLTIDISVFAKRSAKRIINKEKIPEMRLDSLEDEFIYSLNRKMRNSFYGFYHFDHDTREYFQQFLVLVQNSFEILDFEEEQLVKIVEVDPNEILEIEPDNSQAVSIRNTEKKKKKRVFQL